MKIAALILAAGAASRFGSLKQLTLINNKPMLQHCIDNANGPLSGAVYTLLGHQSELIRNHISNTHFIDHRHWAQGIGSSIAAGVTHLRDNFDAILIMLGDQPMITNTHLGQLINLYKDQHVVCSYYQNKLGVPAIFGKPHFDALTELTDDQGAKQLLSHLSSPPKTLSLEIAYRDVDRPEDLVDLQINTYQ